jgi:hypothetical protein
MGSMQSGYKEEFNWAAQSEESSFGTPAYQDMSLEAQGLNWIESSELAVIE